MTYPLGTQLIFNSLTQASAAADLFGRSNLETWHPYLKKWIKGFAVSCYEIPYGFFLFEKWRIVIDTPEKQGWFEPRIDDYVDTYFGGWILSVEEDMFFVDVPFPYGLCGRGLPMHKENIYKIMLRNNKHFPQPCEVIYS